MSRNVLIVSSPRDPHACAVQGALHKLGVSCTILPFVAAPAGRDWRLDPVCGTIEIDDYNYKHACETADFVWYRRIRPRLNEAGIHHDDLYTVRSAWTDFYRDLIETVDRLVPEGARLLHPLALHNVQNSKARQLHTAQQCGLAIPETEFTNAPIALKALEEQGPTICKSFRPASWTENETIKLALTVKFDASKASEDEIRLHPAIYQACIEKAYELRITVFGDHVISMAIYSQELKNSQTDWRAWRRSLRTEIVDIPETLIIQIYEFMDRLQLKFGCFDFIVRPDGSYCFLEVNPSGQFLFKEKAHPETCLLARFVSWISDMPLSRVLENDITIE